MIRWHCEIVTIELLGHLVQGFRWRWMDESATGSER